MLIGIISDVHNNETNLKKVLNYCESNKIAKIICCGDLASDETLDFMADNFKPSVDGEIFYVFGNMDNEQLREFQYVDVYKNINLFRKFGEIEIEDSRVAFVHFPDVAKKLAQTDKYDFVFYGHTHKPWTENVGNCTLLNPGNVAGDYYAPTFAVWNTKDDKFTLVKVHDLV